MATFSESGASFGLAAVKFQVVMAPAAYVFQELGARLGAHCGRGFPQLVAERFGRRAAEACFVLLVWMASYTVFCQFTGISAVASLLDVPRGLPVAAFSLLLLYILFVSTIGEHVALYLSTLLAFFVVLAAAAVAHRGVDDRNLGGLDVADPAFDLVVISATVGGSLTPWISLYQCAATVRARATADRLRDVRRYVAVGVGLAVVCACGVTTSAACEFWTARDDDVTAIATVRESGEAFSDALGAAGTAVFCLGLVGAAAASSYTALTAVLWFWADLYGDGLDAKAETPRGCDPRNPFCENRAATAETREPRPRRTLVGSPVEVAPLLVGEAADAAPGDARAGDALPSCAACRALRESGPPAALCVCVVAVAASLVLAKSNHDQLWLTVHSQDMDALLLVPAMALTLALARALPRDAYSDAEFRAHAAGAVVVALLAWTPMALALAYD